LVDWKLAEPESKKRPELLPASFSRFIFAFPVMPGSIRTG
jgi:hypothetical protein